MQNSKEEIGEAVFQSLYNQGVNDANKLELDSLTVITLLVNLEDRFKTYFDAEDITKENFSSIESITRLVMKKMDGDRKP